MSENTINAALRAMGFPADKVTGHGFQAPAWTMLQAWADYLDPLRLGEVEARRSKGKQTGPERVQRT